MSDKKTIVVYHADCLDGLAAATAAYRRLGDEADYIEGKYHDGFYPELFKDKHVYLVDFSYKRNDFIVLQEVAASVTVLDHHESAHKEIGDLVTIDQTKSGAVLAWEHFNPDKEVPYEFLAVQDRDLWKWEMMHARNYTLGLFALKGDTLESFMSVFHPDKTQEVITYGSIVDDLYQQDLQKLLDEVRYIEFQGYEVPIVNAPMKFASDLGNKLSEGYPFAIIYQDCANFTKFSLRSHEGGVDVNIIAEAMGGGGHKRAAGFTVEYDDAEVSQS